jgi:hypothetical protein
MFGRVVFHVAALAERGEVARRIVGRIVVQVRAGNVDPREPDNRHNVGTSNANAASPSVAPLPPISIPPPAIAKMKDACSMRAPAMLATAFGPTKPDQLRQLGPVDRVKPTMFRRDRHNDSMSQPR